MNVGCLHTNRPGKRVHAVGRLLKYNCSISELDGFRWSDSPARFARWVQRIEVDLLKVSHTVNDESQE